MFNKKGQVGFYLVFIFVAVIIVMIGAVSSTFGSTLATNFYEAGEALLIDTQQNVVTEIDDPAVRAQLNATFTSATAAATTNITVANSLFQYSWIFLLVLVGVVLYLIARSTVAFQKGVV